MLLLEMVSTRTISLLTMDIKTRMLIGVNRNIMEEALKGLNIGAELLVCRSNDMWDILLKTKEAPKFLAGSILATKVGENSTEYMGQRKKR